MLQWKTPNAARFFHIYAMPANSLVYQSPSDQDAIDFVKRSRLRLVLGDGISQGIFNDPLSRGLLIFTGGMVFGITLISAASWFVTNVLFQ
jgi:hypothetical protein